MMADTTALLNPVWATLTGPNARFAEGNDLVARFDPDVSIFCAFSSLEPSPEHWDAMAHLVGPGGTAVVFTEQFDPPSDWTLVGTTAGFQMVKSIPGPAHTVDPRVLELGSDDVADMAALVAATEPGPFERRTIELGRYIGVRPDAALVALAGQRMRFEDYVEISAVCTDPAARGQGLASTLMADLIAMIEAEHKRPILHVRQDNPTAIALYERLGFAVHRPFIARGVQAPGA